MDDSLIFGPVRGSMARVDETTGIAIENNDLLAELCGVNDYNLKIFERLLRRKVFCRGNELFLEDGDEESHGLFKRLMDELLISMEDGMKPTPDLIIALHSTLAHDSPGGREGDEAMSDFRDTCLQIPGGYGKVYARSKAQARLLMKLRDRDIVFAVGPAGTGKTYLAVAHALREVLSKSRRKLVLTRPVVEAGESLGFLPGDLEQKISPYLRPLYDAMESLVPFEIVRRLEESRAIEIAPLAYMRGRSLNHCFVILDEAQNTTKEQMKMFLTRLGEGTKAVITGDVTQIDLPRKSDSGLVHALAVLRGVDEIGLCELESRDVVRNPLVKRIIEAYEHEKA